MNRGRVRGGQRSIRHWPATLVMAKGFGEPPKPETPRQPSNGEAPRKTKAKSLMPLADAASKLLPKESPEGNVKFNNPGVGDFQVFDALVKVNRPWCCWSLRDLAVVYVIEGRKPLREMEYISQGLGHLDTLRTYSSRIDKSRFNFRIRLSRLP